MSKQNNYEHAKQGRAYLAIRATIWSMMNTIVPTVVGTVVFIFASKILRPEEFGLVAFATAVVSVAISLSALGFADSLIQRADVDQKHLDTVFWLCTITGTLLYVLLLLSASEIGKRFGEPDVVDFIYVMGLRVVLDTMAGVPNALLARLMLFKYVAIRTAIASILGAVGCIVLLSLSYGAWALAMSQVMISAASLMGAFVSVSWRPKFSFSLEHLRSLRRLGMSETGSRFITTANLDQLILGALTGPLQFGLYGFAKRTLDILTGVLSGALNSVSYSVMSSMQNEIPKLREAFLLVTFISSAICFPLFIGLAIVAPAAIPLIFGHQWFEAVPIVQVLCIIGLLAGIGIFQSSLIRGLGRAHWWMFYLAGKQLVSVVVIFCMAGSKIYEISVAIVIVNLVLWPIPVAMATRLVGLKIFTYLSNFKEAALSTLTMAVVIRYVLGHFQIDSEIVRVILQVSVGALVYALTLVIVARPKILSVLGMLSSRAARI